MGSNLSNDSKINITRLPSYIARSSRPGSHYFASHLHGDCLAFVRSGFSLRCVVRPFEHEPLHWSRKSQRRRKEQNVIDQDDQHFFKMIDLMFQENANIWRRVAVWSEKGLDEVNRGKAHEGTL